ncbi:hypothetical protein Smp_162560 [Schistosoma mansoni]|nr:hypothetical protein Smp_162560 [Schistosoma mansoni]|eukprot:XP_018650909.1 hypothetical protein Smp_162560 [Schistosoma mansoni]
MPEKQVNSNELPVSNSQLNRMIGILLSNQIQWFLCDLEKGSSKVTLELGHEFILIKTPKNNISILSVSYYFK